MQGFLGIVGTDCQVVIRSELFDLAAALMAIDASSSAAVLEARDRLGGLVTQIWSRAG